MEDYFTNLPNEILEKIFINLTKLDSLTILNLMKTCKKFYNYFKNNCRFTIIDIILSKRLTKNLMVEIKNIFNNSELYNYNYIEKQLLLAIITEYFPVELNFVILTYQKNIKNNIFNKDTLIDIIKNTVYNDDDDDNDDIIFIPHHLISLF